MPELPEVETVRRGLERTIVGKTVKAVDVRVPKLFADPQVRITEALIGAKVERVERRAKVLLIHLSSGWVLAIHLKMTGQLIVVNSKQEAVNRNSANHGVSTVHRSQFTVHAGFVGGHPEQAYDQLLPHKHTHVIITFADGATLFFNDLRKFGWLRLYPNRELGIMNVESIQQFLAASKHGPEPLGDEFTFGYFAAGLRKRSTTIKQLLLDQQFIAGIGNIYADEALFQAKILPTRRANKVTKAEAAKLFAAIREVLELGIKHGGTSMNTYRNVDGTKGGMRQHLKVYGREGEPCLVCGTPIVRRKIGQRSSHFCPSCQK